MPRNTRIFIYDVDFDDENVENEIEPGDLIEWDNFYLSKQHEALLWAIPYHMGHIIWLI